jgi:hypothetical protein
MLVALCLAAHYVVHGRRIGPHAASRLHASRRSRLVAYGRPTPLYFVQTPKEVRMIFSGDHQVRRDYMDVATGDLELSWYGESVGRYERDSLVIGRKSWPSSTTRLKA